MIEKGVLLFRTLERDPEQWYYLYCPPAPAKGIVVSVHGISLNANSHAKYFLPYAEANRYILVVPLFARDRYMDYNVLGLSAAGHRADKVFNEIMDEVCRSTGSSDSSINLCGYSAGAQFAHRYALCYPEKIRRLVLCSPGYYTMPNSEPWPLGLNGLTELSGMKIDLREFLSIPTLLTVGEKDTLRNASLLQTDEIDHIQGMNRIERAKTWFEAVQKVSRDLGIPDVHYFKLLPGVGHGFEATAEKTSMLDDIFCFLEMPDIVYKPQQEITLSN